MFSCFPHDFVISYPSPDTMHRLNVIMKIYCTSCGSLYTRIKKNPQSAFFFFFFFNYTRTRVKCLVAIPLPRIRIFALILAFRARRTVDLNLDRRWRFSLRYVITRFKRDRLLPSEETRTRNVEIFFSRSRNIDTTSGLRALYGMTVYFNVHHPKLGQGPPGENHEEQGSEKIRPKGKRTLSFVRSIVKKKTHDRFALSNDAWRVGVREMWEARWHEISWVLSELIIVIAVPEGFRDESTSRRYRYR